MLHDKTAGLKRIRWVTAIIGAVMFGITGAQQFGAEGQEFVIPGVLISAVIGFALLFVIMTIIIFVMRMFKKGD